MNLKALLSALKSAWSGAPSPAPGSAPQGRCESRRRQANVFDPRTSGEFRTDRPEAKPLLIIHYPSANYEIACFLRKEVPEWLDLLVLGGAGPDKRRFEVVLISPPGQESSLARISSIDS